VPPVLATVLSLLALEAPAPAPVEAPDAAEPAPTPSEPPAPPVAAPPVAAPPPTVLHEQLDRLERELAALRSTNEKLAERLEVVEEDQTYETKRVDGLMPLSGRVSGYIDTGVFWVQGNGSGLRPDIGNQVFPQYAGKVPDSWVFLGDPLSTAINSRGEPADTGDSRAVAFDSVDSRGKASFIVNNLNVALTGNMGDTFSVNGLIDFLPRNRAASDPNGLMLGDYIDVKLAYMSWRPRTKRVKLELSVGKIDPVFGYEYRIQESPDRITVTPSLLCRYVCGRPVGIKLRQKFFDESLIVALSLTNGSPMWEGFGLAADVDQNNVKTATGRVSYRLPVRSTIEMGGSGMIGAEDLQPDDRRRHWQAGADLHIEVWRLDLTGEFVQGSVAGKTSPGGVHCDTAMCLQYRSAYGLLGVRATNWFMPYVRVDWRDAIHQNGANFLYISKLARVTGGVRFEIGTHAIVKAEYTHDRELGPIPQFNNDLVTTSFIGRF
jgi:hypothetical protein